MGKNPLPFTAPTPDIVRARFRVDDRLQRRAGLRTDPDTIEIAEEVAEHLRVYLFEENDGLDDRVIELAASYYPETMTGPIDDEVTPEEFSQILEYAEQEAWSAVLSHLRPLITEVLRRGDWKEENAEVQP